MLVFDRARACAPPPSHRPAAPRPRASPRARARRASLRRRDVEPCPASAISVRGRAQKRVRYPLGFQGARHKTTRALHKCNAATDVSDALPAVCAPHAALLNSAALDRPCAAGGHPPQFPINAARPRNPAGACYWRRGSSAWWPGCCGCDRRSAVSPPAITAPTAAISPFLIAASALSCVPPSGASISDDISRLARAPDAGCSSR